MDLKPSERQNVAISKFLAEIDVVPPEADNDYFSEHFTYWRSNIQDSISENIPRWKETCKLIAEEWGWTIERMDKDPMLLEGERTPNPT